MKQALSPQDFDAPLPYFCRKAFATPEQDGIFHGFFTRQGGESTGIYGALNCGPGSEDNPEDVSANRIRVAETVGCAPSSLLSLHQIHSATAITVTAPWSAQARPQADGMATDVPGLGLAILTADCAPVLFYGRKADGAPVIGAAHAGWGGALKGVLEATLVQMEALGAARETVRASIGPCIGKNSYEVTVDFSAPFLAEDPENERFFMETRRTGHLMFDLSGYCATKLASSGVARVFIRDLDTYFNEEDFFSYRRTTHRKDVDYGRQVSVIMIRP
ncbi:MAG: peptidoglycan editing factor PgeF [Alphaproteobacteria bacterium]|nr:peptidoglycan editing factor PgeF [Alphaproteobacteria bacterium]